MQRLIDFIRLMSIIRIGSLVRKAVPSKPLEEWLIHGEKCAFTSLDQLCDYVRFSGVDAAMRMAGAAVYHGAEWYGTIVVTVQDDFWGMSDVQVSVRKLQK